MCRSESVSTSVTLTTSAYTRMSSKQVSSAGNGKRGRDETASRDVNVFCLLVDECDADQLGYLVAQQQAITLEGEVERHDNTNNPGKGRTVANLKYRLLNLVLKGDREYPAVLKSRLQFDSNAAANSKNSKSSRAQSLWTAVSKLASRVETVQKCFEKGA
jgi:hypothetical protein